MSTPEAGLFGLTGNGPAADDLPKVVVVPFGIEGSVSYGGGTANGPRAIIEASHQVELFDEELWCEPYRRFRLETMAPFPIADGVGAAVDQVEAIVEKIVADGAFPLVLGGEHSLTAGAIRPLAARHDGLVILQFDAHADLRDGYDGEHYSHAAAMRRCLDDPAISIVSVGIRNISAEEIPFLETNRDRIQIHWAKNREDWDVAEIVAGLAGRPVYLTFDLDGFDASLMPATGTPEPGGLFWSDATRIIRTAAESAGEIVGCDITELSPIPGFHACDFLAAKLAYKILAYRFAL